MNFILLLLLLSTSINSVKGVVEISPSAVAPVCQEGDELELICNTSGIAHRWEFTVPSENMTYTTTPVTSAGISGIPEPLTISTSMITFSRLVGPNVLPLISRITINPVSSGLNGTVVNCFEGGISSTEPVATTTIQIIADSDEFNLSIRSHSEDFSRDGVTVLLEWTLLNSQTYYQQFLRNVSVSADPPPNSVMFARNMRFQLVLSYNTLYNVSVTQHSTCEQLIRTTYLQLNYNKCTNPMVLTNARAVGYEDPALEGQIITFTCAPGQVLNGSNQAICIQNGKWEPDPREVECTGFSTQATATTVGHSVTTGTTSVKCSSPLYVLQISESIRVVKESPRQEFNDTDTCCSSGFLINSGANTTICLENREWELDTSQMNSCEGVSATVAMLRTALISVTCVLVMMSVFIFIIGFVCNHYISQRWRESADNSKQQQVTNPKNMESDLELKENVAYITVHPRS